MIRTKRLAVLVAAMSGPLSIYIAQPIAPVLSQSLGISAMVTGLIVAAPTIGLALASPFAGAVSDVIGRKRSMTMALLAMILPTLLLSFSDSLGAILLCQFLIGLCIPGVSAVTLAYVGDEFDADSTPQMVSLVISANIAGGFLGRFLSALAAEHWSWQQSFQVIALCQGLAAAWLLLSLPGDSRRPGRDRLRDAFRGIPSVIRDPSLFMVFATGFTILFLIVGVFTYAGFRLVAPPYDLGVGTVGLLYLLYLLSMILTPVSGRIMKRLAPSRFLALNAAVAAGGLLLTLLGPLPLVLAGMLVFVVAAFFCQSAASTQLVRSSAERRGTASGLYSTFYYAGGGVGAALPGLVWERWGWPGVTAIFLVACGLAALAALLGWRERSAAPPRPAAGG